MILHGISLHHFRNFHTSSFNFTNRITKIYGPNGSGKTNLLEAIFILFTTKSFRNKKTLFECTDVAQTDYFSIQGKIENDENFFYFDGKNRTKTMRINQKEINSLQFIEGKKIIYFSPEETMIFFQSQENKRNILDRYISSTDDSHLSLLIEYRIMKKEKEIILKSDSRHKRMMIEKQREKFEILSTKISEKRRDFLQEIKSDVLQRIQRMNENIVDLDIVFKENNFSKGYLEREILEKNVLYGCQRDEMNFKTGTGIKAKAFFSNGEKKTINLAFHFGYLDYLKRKEKENNGKCIVCLDDIESEMDNQTTDNIMEMLQVEENQVIITTKSENQMSDSHITLKK